MRPDLIKTTERKTAKVTLNDCLACSGCVTSAEAVLITQQSSLEFRTHVTSGRYARIVVSLSPQAIASIAARFDVTCGVAYRRLAAYFRTLGVHHVVDTLSASNVSLLETAAEFVARRRRRGSGGAGAGAGAAADAGAAVPATSDDAAAKRLRTALPGSVEPLLSSACPGCERRCWLVLAVARRRR
jgi:iron only hydrogenase large subunit-like protein